MALLNNKYGAPKTLYRRLVAVIAVCAAAAGCSVIAGREDAASPRPGAPQLRIEYRESLRSQASLRGEAFRDTDFGASPALSLQRPSSVAADSNRVYVTDLSPASRIAVFDRADRTMKFLSIPTTTGAPTFGLLQPSGVAVDENSFIYVADPQQGRVFGFDRNGALLLTLGKFGELSYPAALAMDGRRGRLYVADKHRHVVRVFSSLNGSHLFDLAGAPRQKGIRSPVGIALDRSGFCYVVGDSAKKIYVFDPDGKQSRVLVPSGTIPEGTIRTTGIAVDSAGHIYLADGLNNRILIFGADGAFLQSWGRTGSLRGDFWTPAGIFIDGRDTIYIADQTNARIQVYQFEK